MHFPVEPYLAALQKELATSLAPKGDDNTRRIAGYAHRILTQMLLRSSTLPALQHKAIAELDTILDELNAVLRSINSSMVLTGDLTQHMRNDPNYALLEPVLQRTVSVLLANSSETGKRLLQRISAILFRFQDALHQAVLDNNLKTNAEEAGDPPPLTESQQLALQAYLRRQFIEPELEIGNLKIATGGGSKKTLIVELRHVRQLPATVVVRADQSSGTVESTVSNEYHLIETLHAEGLPVPRPLASETDTSIIGAPFVVVGHIEGRNIGDYIKVDEPSRSFGVGLARAMGKLHRIPPERFGDKVPGAKVSTVERVHRDIASFEATWRNSGRPSVGLELAYAWLKDHLQFAEGLRALNHCDIGCHNMLVKEGELAAILDWETAVVGNPAHDLAYVYIQAVQTMPWEDFLAEYEKAGGTVPRIAEFDFYRLWTNCWRLSFTCVAQSFFHSGISSSVVHAYIAQPVHQYFEHELHSVLDDISQRY